MKNLSLVSAGLARAGGASPVDVTCPQACEEFYDRYGNRIPEHLDSDDIHRQTTQAGRRIGTSPLLKTVFASSTFASGAALGYSYKVLIESEIQDRLLVLDAIQPSSPTPSCAPGCPPQLVPIEEGANFGYGDLEAPADGLYWNWLGSDGSSWWQSRLVPGQEPFCNDHPAVPPRLTVLSGTQNAWCYQGRGEQVGFLPYGDYPEEPLSDYSSGPVDATIQDWPTEPETRQELEAAVEEELDTNEEVGSRAAHAADPRRAPAPGATRTANSHKCDRGTPAYEDRVGQLPRSDEFLPVPSLSGESSRYQIGISPPGAPSSVFLRTGRTFWGPWNRPVNDPLRRYKDDWRGWGYAHIKAKHGWNAEDEDETRDALYLAPPVAGHKNRYNYVLPVDPVGGIDCTRVVVVQFDRRGDDPAALHIITSFNRVD